MTLKHTRLRKMRMEPKGAISPMPVYTSANAMVFTALRLTALRTVPSIALLRPFARFQNRDSMERPIIVHSTKTPGG